MEFTDNRGDGFRLCCVGLGVFVFFIYVFVVSSC